ncbi:hypothetical protein CMK11_01135 [Candidatus Poribacteria bacterium]|nr:hypothetical protein [Candidatus Poribacteria bacterium]
MPGEPRDQPREVHPRERRHARHGDGADAQLPKGRGAELALDHHDRAPGRRGGESRRVDLRGMPLRASLVRPDKAACAVLVEVWDEDVGPQVDAVGRDAAIAPREQAAVHEALFGEGA